jgi:hypothetical protein
VVELVDTLVLGASIERCEGSSPFRGTRQNFGQLTGFLPGEGYKRTFSELVERQVQVLSAAPHDISIARTRLAKGSFQMTESLFCHPLSGSRTKSVQHGLFRLLNPHSSCQYAGISRDTYYRHLGNEVFAEKMRAAFQNQNTLVMIFVTVY